MTEARVRPRRARRPSRTAAALPVLVLALGLLVVPDTGRASTRTCQGQPVTIVGSQGATLVGTSGDDVVMLDGAASLHAGAGDDLVCSGTPPTDHFHLAGIDTGPGDDSVVLDDDASVDLGAGADRFSGPGGSEVDAGDDDDVARGAGPSQDSITLTALGQGEVTTGADGLADDDQVHIGDGIVHVVGFPVGRFVADHHPSLLVLDSTHGGDWSVDISSGTIAVGGATATASGFDDYNFDRFVASSLQVTGSVRSDIVELPGPPDAVEGPVDIRLGAGNDIFAPSEVSAQLDGGPGRDAVQFSQDDDSRRPLRVDLASGTYTDGRDGTGAFSRIEVAEVITNGTQPARVTGSAGPDDIEVFSCTGVVVGGAGNDRIRLRSEVLGPSTGCGVPPGHPAFVVHGGGGDDRLQGSTGNDVLDGGPGRDTAQGLAGVDICRAEVEQGCER